ncbi:hypothetical protein [Sodalis-like endosymbiont of Proechinophthirus fluctus]|uniref:hypothetical protein n=1 Tax=Sodalis-like endosymbiont of Proechinophthirus fluctus TaxID=1462730 RepID=UPI000AEC9C33|nr:hypothetical protein [Sodalis-like endosymbiont of Proechinophthirus fluctus]
MKKFIGGLLLLLLLMGARLLLSIWRLAYSRLPTACWPRLGPIIPHGSPAAKP